MRLHNDWFDLGEGKTLTTRLFKTVAFGLLAFSSAALAQEKFPSRPIHIITPYGAGPTDVTARVFAESLTTQLGSPVIVENRSGALGKIGMDAVKQAGPDGYNIYLATPYQAVILPIVFEEGSDTLKTFLKEFRPVGLANAYDLIINTGTPSGVRSIRDVVDKARAPGSNITYVSTGAGSLTDLVFEGIADATKVKFTPIIYRGSGTAISDLMTGRITVAVDAPASIAGYIKEGRIVALAATGKVRSNQMPDVPTLSETGLPEISKLDFRVWNAFFVPAGTPNAVVTQLNEALRRTADDTRLKARFSAGGYEVLAKATLRETQAFLDEKYKSWEPLLKKMGVKVSQ